MNNISNVSVIGAGTMGNGIAHVCAQAGYKVVLCDLAEAQLERAMSTISRNLDRRITEQGKNDTLARITTSTSVEEGVSNADIVIEAASELFEVKRAIFTQLDSLVKPETILATNTSSISIAQIAGQTSRPEKVIGMHFFNPVPVMKLVEVIRAYGTDDETTSTVMVLSRKLGKVPVEVNDYPGFISNRVLMPMINESISALYEGVAGVEEIDTVMKLGMAHPMGPLQLADFIGLDVCKSIMDVLYNGFGNPKYAACPLLINMVSAGKLGRKSGEGFYIYEKGNKELKVSTAFG